MSNQFKILTLMAACVILGACLNSLFAVDNSPSTWKSLELNYAKANVDLAESRLAQAKGQNASVAESVSVGLLAELQAGVQLAKARLQQLSSNNNKQPFGPEIAAAAAAVKTLEVAYNESLKANQLEAGAVSEPELRREQAEINVAKTRLAALSALAQQTPEVRIRWQISQLQDQVRALWARPFIED